MADSQHRTQSPAPWHWIALAHLILGGMIALNLYLDHHRTAQLEQDRLATQARVIAENMQHLLSSANYALESVRNNSANWQRSAGPVDATGELQAITHTLRGIRTINIMDAAGIIAASNRTELIGRNLSYREYFQTARQSPGADTLYVSPPFETVLGSYAINTARMLPGPGGEFAGLVSATLDPEYFRTLMLSVQYAPDMWVSVAHGDGVLFLMMPERQGVQGMNIAQPGSFFTRHRSSGKEAEVLTGTVYATKEERMMALRTIQPAALNMDKALIIAVSRDLDAVFASWLPHALMQGGMFLLIAVSSSAGLLFHQRRQRRLEQQAAEARVLAERFRIALDRIPTYIYMKDQQRRYVYANRATLELFNCSAEQLPGSVDAQFFPPDTVAQLHDIDSRILEHGEDTAEKVFSHDRDGSRRTYWEIKTPIYDDNDRTRIWGLCGISTDITELELLREQLEQQAQQDYLTGLHNRRHFLEIGRHELARALRYNQPLSLLMIDIDHFKDINDTHGHQAGDAALQRFSELMLHTLRAIDSIGRIGGEEFAVILPDTALERATEVAERLRELVATTEFALGSGIPQRLTISIGVAAVNGTRSSLDELLRLADKALYQAKESGRNQVCAS